jgi:hypothetical protein
MQTKIRWQTNLCCPVMVCTVGYSMYTYFEHFPKTMIGLIQIEIWTSPFMKFRVVWVNFTDKISQFTHTLQYQILFNYMKVMKIPQMHAINKVPNHI